MRRRLGVVLLLPEPWSSEVNGLRRALGAPSLGTQPPHLTVVPPVNVAQAQLDQAVGVLRRAAERCEPTLSLTVGPPATFAPVSPVAYLRISGDVDGLQRLQTDACSGPLHRRIDYDYVPHVTLHESASDRTISQILEVLGDFRCEMVIDRVHLLQQDHDGVWRPLTDVGFGPPVVRGRGGAELHLRWSMRPAPDAQELVSRYSPWWVPDEPSSDFRRVSFLEARDLRGVLIGVRSGQSVVVSTDWLGYGIEERLLDEPTAL